jgi:glutamine amidotransferase-like uncharacterized protein
MLNPVGVVSVTLFEQGSTIDPWSLRQDCDDAWPHVRKWRSTIQSYVGSGGRYIGFCLGAYFAGSDPGFELLPSGIDTDQYITSRGASVKHDKDTIVQVDWSSGAPAQQSPFFGAGRWLFFQDGPLIDVSEASLPAGAKVLGRYRSNGALAAVLSPYGKGWVGVIGPHPEADQSWCKCDQDYNVTSPSTN